MLVLKIKVSSDITINVSIGEEFLWCCVIVVLGTILYISSKIWRGGGGGVSLFDETLTVSSL